jgi:hypothetical protein
MLLLQVLGLLDEGFLGNLFTDAPQVGQRFTIRGSDAIRAASQNLLQSLFVH